MEKGRHKVRKNTMLRAELVYNIVKEHYEEGRQDGCLLWVYRNRVNKVYPMSVATFWRCLRLAEQTRERLNAPHPLTQGE